MLEYLDKFMRHSIRVYCRFVFFCFNESYIERWYYNESSEPHCTFQNTIFVYQRL